MTGDNAASTDGQTGRAADPTLGVAPEGRSVSASDVPLPLPGVITCIECGALCSQGRYGPERRLCSARCKKRRSRRLRLVERILLGPAPCWCGRPVEPPLTAHPECKAVRTALEVFRRAVESQASAGLAPLDAGPLRKDLIGLAWKAAPGRIGRTE